MSKFVCDTNENEQIRRKFVLYLELIALQHEQRTANHMLENFFYKSKWFPAATCHLETSNNTAQQIVTIHEFNLYGADCTLLLNS